MVDYIGDNLEVHLDLAWKAAVTSFPAMARTYEAANGAVHWTHAINGLDVEFLRSWEQLRDQAEYIFGDSARNLNDTAVAICASLKAFAETDDDAADIISDTIKDGHDEEVTEIKGTSIPLSGQYYASDDYFTPLQPDVGALPNDAPSIDQLIEKASELEDKLFEAMCTEMDALDGWIMSWFSREWYLDTAEGPNIEQTTGGIVEKIQSCTKHEPGQFDLAVGCLESITSSSNPFDSFRQQVNNAKDGLDPDKWDSAAASDLRENFLNAYEDISSNHVALAGTLHGTLSGYRQAIIETHKTYDQILQAGIENCESIIDSGNARIAALATAALKAGITLFGEIKSGGGFGFSLATDAIEIAAIATNVGGSKVEEIRTNTISAIDTSHGNLTDLDQELASSLASDYDRVYSARHDPDMKIDLPKPQFTYYGAEPF